METLSVEITKKERKTAIAALVLVQLIFGFNYVATKIILEQFHPLLWGGIRILIAAILMFICAFIIVPKEQRRMDRPFLLKCALYGLIGIGMNQAFFLLGLANSTTANAAILNSLTPIMALLFAVMLGLEKWSPSRGFAFVMAITGVLVLRNVEDFQLSSATFKGDFFTLLNCASLALFFAISRDFLRANSAFWVTAWMFFFSAIGLVAVGAPDLASLNGIHLDQRIVLAMLYNIIGATMITYFLNSWTLKKVNPSMVALFIYLQPVIAVFNAWFVYDEAPTVRMAIAISCIFTGVVVGVVKRT